MNFFNKLNVTKSLHIFAKIKPHLYHKQLDESYFSYKLPWGRLCEFSRHFYTTTVTKVCISI